MRIGYFVVAFVLMLIAPAWSQAQSSAVFVITI